MQVAADARWGVGAVKAAALQAALGSVEKAEAAALVGRCHLRRTRQGAQVKEIEGQTLLTLGIRDGAEVYVRAGAGPCARARPAAPPAVGWEPPDEGRRAGGIRALRVDV